MFNNQEPLQLVVAFFVLMMVMYESGVILYGEIRCSSLLGAGKGLTIYIIASIFSYFDFSNIGGQMVYSGMFSRVGKNKGNDIKSLFCYLTTRSIDVGRNVSTAYRKSSSGDGVDWLWHGIIWLVVARYSTSSDLVVRQQNKLIISFHYHDEQQPISYQ